MSLSSRGNGHFLDFVSSVSDPLPVLEMLPLYDSRQEMGLTLAGWLSQLEDCPTHSKVVGSIPSQGMYQVCESILSRGAYGRRPIDVSLSH